MVIAGQAGVEGHCAQMMVALGGLNARLRRGTVQLATQAKGLGTSGTALPVPKFRALCRDRQ